MDDLLSGFDRPEVLVPRLVVGAIFLLAGVRKLRDPQAFAKAISSYKLLPDAAAGKTAIVLPIAEILTGAMLVLSMLVIYAAAAALSLLALFIAVTVVQVARGHQSLNCGCFGATRSEKAWAVLSRDAGLSLLATVPHDLAEWRSDANHFVLFDHHGVRYYVIGEPSDGARGVTKEQLVKIASSLISPE